MCVHAVIGLRPRKAKSQLYCTLGENLTLERVELRVILWNLTWQHDLRTS